MSADRELLELAAKAAGMDGYEYNDGYTNAYYAGSKFYMTKPRSHTPWNPLEDDGDALRLVVTLRECEPQINIANDGCQVQAWTELVQSDCSQDEDHAANLRRAIVRFAAQIGRNMP